MGTLWFGSPFVGFRLPSVCNQMTVRLLDGSGVPLPAALERLAIVCGMSCLNSTVHHLTSAQLRVWASLHVRLALPCPPRRRLSAKWDRCACVLTDEA